MSDSMPLRDLLYENTMTAAPELTLREAEGSVRCVACGHRCLIRPGKAGICRVRFNRGGELLAPSGYVAGLAADPIEKKPFYHAYPGRDALTFGMLGCDLHCSYCQNWITSQALRDDHAVSMPTFIDAERLVDLAVQHDCPVIVSSYNEPLITADWAVQIFKLARQRGIECGFVSNGNATPEVLEFLRPHMELLKVDLKGFDDRNYRKLGAVLANICDSIRRIHELGFWTEIVTLIVPGFNDDDDELKALAEFIASVSADIPWHVTAFHPDYKMTGPPRTSSETLFRAYDIGKEAGLRYVYAGNLPGSVGDRENTRCPKCGKTLIERWGFTVRANRLVDGRCPDCQTAIPGRWEPNAPQRSTGGGFPRPVGR